MTKGLIHSGELEVIVDQGGTIFNCIDVCMNMRYSLIRFKDIIMNKLKVLVGEGGEKEKRKKKDV